MGKQWKQWQALFSWTPKSLQMVTADTKLRKPMTNLDSILESRDITLPTKVYIVKSMVFPVVMDGCESWTIKKAEHWRCFWTMMLEKSLQSPLDCKVIKPINPKGNQFWIFTGRTDVEAPTLWLPDAKNWLIRKVPDAGKDWWQEDKGTVEDEMVGWHHQLSGHVSEQVPEDGEVQGRLACCSPSGHKELDVTEWLSNNKYKFMSLVILFFRRAPLQNEERQKRIWHAWPWITFEFCYQE